MQDRKTSKKINNNHQDEASTPESGDSPPKSVHTKTESDTSLQAESPPQVQEQNDTTLNQDNLSHNNQFDNQQQEGVNQIAEIKLPQCKEIQEFVQLQQQIGQTIQMRKRLEKHLIKQQEKLQVNDSNLIDTMQQFGGICNWNPPALSETNPYIGYPGLNPMMSPAFLMQQYNFNPLALQASLMQQMFIQQFLLNQMCPSPYSYNSEQLAITSQFNTNQQVITQHEQLPLDSNNELDEIFNCQQTLNTNMSQLDNDIIKEIPIQNQITNSTIQDGQIGSKYEDTKANQKTISKESKKSSSKIQANNNQKQKIRSRKSSQIKPQTNQNQSSKGDTNYSQYKNLAKKSTSQDQQYDDLNDEESKISSVTVSEMNDELSSQDDCDDGDFKPRTYSSKNIYKNDGACCQGSAIGQEQNNNLVGNENRVKSSRPQRNASLRATYDKHGIVSSYNQIDTYQLLQCSQYKSFSQQPYQIYISQEALIMLNIHAHLSKNEVIGFLGGYSFNCKDNNKKYIIIKQVYPCDSIVDNLKARQKNCELCPESAANARQQIQNNSQQIIGWYHSHPFFKVEPSNIDIRNHAIYQQNFDMEQLPFIALIVGPYSVKKRNDSLVKIFHLNKNIPYSLCFKYIPSTKLRKNMLQEIKDLFGKYENNMDSINMKDKWSPKITREEKLLKCLLIDLQKNHKLKGEFDLQADILQHLKHEDKISYYMRDNGTWNTQDTLNGESIAKDKIQQQEKVCLNTPLPPLNGNSLSSESLISKSTAADEQLSNLNSRSKESYFSIETQDKIDRFIAKVSKSMQNTLFKGTNIDQKLQARSNINEDNVSGAISCASSTKDDECHSNNQLSQQISTTVVSL